MCQRTWVKSKFISVNILELPEEEEREEGVGGIFLEVTTEIFKNLK